MLLCTQMLRFPIFPTTLARWVLPCIPNLGLWRVCRLSRLRLAGIWWLGLRGLLALHPLVWSWRFVTISSFLWLKPGLWLSGLNRTWRGRLLSARPVGCLSELRPDRTWRSRLLSPWPARCLSKLWSDRMQHRHLLRRNCLPGLPKHGRCKSPRNNRLGESRDERDLGSKHIQQY